MNRSLCRSLVTASCFTLSFVLPSVFTAESSAQEPTGKGTVYTEAPENEPSFPLMGEFAGEIKLEDAEPQRIAIQIRPFGKDSFEAIHYNGGLPGENTKSEASGEPLQLIGRRSDEFVILSGGPYVIVVEKDGCIVVDRKGNRIGVLARVVRQSPSMGAPPPKDAMVLFDGSSTDQFTAAQMNEAGLLTQGATIKPMLQDFNLHLEFRLPYMPEADGQSRGNSGIYLQSRYECQILDSFATLPVFNGLGSLYRFRTPDFNMALPPLAWQTYDIQFTAPRWAADGTKIRGAHVTSWVNGVKVQDNIELPSQTGHGKDEAPTLLPTLIQDHGDPVRFRNIWIVDRGLSSGEFPIFPTQEELDALKKQEQEKIEQQKKAAQKKAAREQKEKERKAKEAREAKQEAEQAKQEAEQAKMKAEQALKEAAKQAKQEAEAKATEKVTEVAAEKAAVTEPAAETEAE
ncbi:3-keto-disaccharide hydrolase [Novipirellula artificiosorum]|uniref:3-keto-alpha-glucoside-1,2-lyase/3-keto-2-hydroxy-glucal hydratase domain-containing protein n=1 Tax=Novipirellula artificiosorum TaxID=2528016 RepID=A0A5C6DIW7_9BACT|nr:DUF1080 domain-containing protein [Novipirellula artificiosorum]TWU36044.1 hypothetical protein Poly41_37970 [Novipirellula artificiosorum]